MNIELYRWEGECGPFRIKSKCEECDVNTDILKSLQQEFPDRVKLDIKPWLNYWGRLLLRRGAWHAPITIIDGRLYAQGKFFSKEKLKALILEGE